MQFAYFDHAAVAALSAPAQAAVGSWLAQAAEGGDFHWLQWSQKVQACRQSAAKLIGANSSEIALVPNTTWGITLVAEGLDWRPGDNLVTLDNEFPSNQFPWLNLQSRGVEVRRVRVEDGRVDLSAVAEAFDAKTRLLAISWVGFASGWRISVDDAVELAHQRGALFFLDAIQGLGVFPLDVSKTPVDFLAADGHKWLLGPEGAGLFYVRQEHLERLRPIGVGWNSVKVKHKFATIDAEMDLRPDAARFEGGTLNMAGFIGLRASLDLLMESGVGPNSAALAGRVIELGNLLCDALKQCGAKIVTHRGTDCSSGIISFLPPRGEPNAVRTHCLERGVILSVRNGALRAAVHGLNHEEDIGRLMEALGEAAGG